MKTYNNKKLINKKHTYLKSISFRAKESGCKVSTSELNYFKHKASKIQDRQKIMEKYYFQFYHTKTNNKNSRKGQQSLI